jgi:hypothetical protein
MLAAASLLIPLSQRQFPDKRFENALDTAVPRLSLRELAPLCHVKFAPSEQGVPK